MPTFRTSRTFDVIFLLAVTSLLIVAALNRQSIGDKMFFLNYHPTAKTIQLAKDAGLSDSGRTLLYRTNPQFASREAIIAECDIERLGCLSSKGQTFILYDPAKPAQTIVTGAHEMLHLAYRRLSQSQKDDLAPLIDQAITANAINISDELKSVTTLEDRRDEAHSLLGTEYKNLSPKLETYYAKYFSDRSKVLAAASDD
jgi:hypothetical protein